MLGSATKLKNARNIALTGAVTGNANFDGTGNVSIITTQANIAILTGTLVADGTSNLEKDITYPAGYNSNNCIVIGCMLHNQSNTNETYATGTVFSSSGYVRGSMPCQVSMSNSGIKIQSKNILIQDGQAPSVPNISVGTIFDFKVILMKIA